jgi:predicted GNAT superfamily acetyltransferase
MTPHISRPEFEPGTDLPVDCGSTSSIVVAAVTAAEAAARAAGVQVRELSTHQDLDAVCDMFVDIWHPDPTDAPMTSDLLRALNLTGSYISGAFDASGLVGGCVGFFGAPASNSLHSHITGVSGAGRGRSVGFALKLHQRAWSLVRGIATVAWTFDPLIRRNAYLNLVKLAASGDEYFPNFYGDMRDALNGSDDSDRLLVTWHLGSPAVAAACSGSLAPADAQREHAAGAGAALRPAADGSPMLGPTDGETLLVAVPADIETMRTRDPGCARGWRLAVRETLGALLEDGAHVSGFDPAGWYVIRRGDER